MSTSNRRPITVEKQETFLRRVELKTAVKKGHPAPWLFKAAGYGQLLTVPVIVGYFMFYADYGEKEHVFSEPRRWFERQKAAYLGQSQQDSPPIPTSTSSSSP